MPSAWPPADGEPRQLALELEPVAPAANRLPESVAARRLELERRRAFRETLGTALDGRLQRLTFTRNRSTLVSARDAGRGRIDVRIQQLFVDAPEDVVDAVARVCLGRAGSRCHEAIRRWYQRRLEEQGASDAERPPREAPLRPRGRTFDLEKLRDDLSARFFGERLDVPITWGRGGSTRAAKRQRSVQLGCYDFEAGVIRIHPVLDDPRVPEFVVASVVYHELLHVVEPPRGEGSRRRVHPAAFRRRERLYPQLDRAERWLERHVFRLLREGRRPPGPAEEP